ncbi:hypothetical protein P9112_004513 [Eukaryota sp. TZLM1-RC]
MQYSDDYLSAVMALFGDGKPTMDTSAPSNDLEEQPQSPLMLEQSPIPTPVRTGDQQQLSPEPPHKRQPSPQWDLKSSARSGFVHIPSPEQQNHTLSARPVVQPPILNPLRNRPLKPQYIEPRDTCKESEEVIRVSQDIESDLACINQTGSISTFSCVDSILAVASQVKSKPSITELDIQTISIFQDLVLVMVEAIIKVELENQSSVAQRLPIVQLTSVLNFLFELVIPNMYSVGYVLFLAQNMYNSCKRSFIKLMSKHGAMLLIFKCLLDRLDGDFLTTLTKSTLKLQDLAYLIALGVCSEGLTNTESDAFDNLFSEITTYSAILTGKPGSSLLASSALELLLHAEDPLGDGSAGVIGGYVESFVTKVIEKTSEKGLIVSQVMSIVLQWCSKLAQNMSVNSKKAINLPTIPGQLSVGAILFRHSKMFYSFLKSILAPHSGFKKQDLVPSKEIRMALIHFLRHLVKILHVKNSECVCTGIVYIGRILCEILLTDGQSSMRALAVSTLNNFISIFGNVDFTSEFSIDTKDLESFHRVIESSLITSTSTDPSKVVRSEAVKTLGLLNQSQSIGSCLVERLNDPDPNVLLHSLEVLVHYVPQDQSLLRWIRTKCNSAVKNLLVLFGGTRGNSNSYSFLEKVLMEYLLDKSFNNVGDALQSLQLGDDVHLLDIFFKRNSEDLLKVLSKP